MNMKFVKIISIPLILCCVLLAVLYTGVQSAIYSEGITWGSEEECSLCNIKEQLQSNTGVTFGTYIDQKETASTSEPWSIEDCYTTPEGNCELCIQTLDHDGDGPKPAEVHLWFRCDGKLVWHVWCEDPTDPSTCKCLDGCTMDSLPIGFFDIQDLISNKP